MRKIILKESVPILFSFLVIAIILSISNSRGMCVRQTDFGILNFSVPCYAGIWSGLISASLIFLILGKRKTMFSSGLNFSLSLIGGIVVAFLAIYGVVLFAH